MNNIFYRLLKKLHWKWVYFTSQLYIKLTEPFYDRKFNIKTYKTYYLKDDTSQNKDSTFYMGYSYVRIFQSFKYAALTKNDILVDIGSGLGRVIFLAKLYGVKKAIGIELDEYLHKMALENIKTCSVKGDTELVFINGDAALFHDNEPTVYVLFNPFGIKTLRVVMNNIKDTLNANPRKIRIIYLSGWQKDCQAYMDSLDWLQRMKIKEKHVPSIYISK